uniref:LRAT domain-containing protein n=1 Tax=Panagrolaimus sp. JU765 TaxID=591449 RepID=A0AC34R3T5_9BILA
MDCVLERDEIPKQFRDRVDNALNSEKMARIVQKIWGRTKHGQHFVFVVSSWLWYAVRLFVEEEYWNYEVLDYQNVNANCLYERRGFWTFKEAKKYMEETLENIKKNNFEKKLRFRVRKVPELTTVAGVGSHEGIYLGNGKVAHVSAEDHITLNTKSRAYPRIDTLEKFLGDPGAELRIVDHCFRQRDPESIVGIAQLIVDNYEELQNYDMLPYQDGWLRVYNLLANNCQHFATFCAVGHESMTEAEELIKKAKKFTFSTTFIVGMAVFAVCLEEPSDPDLDPNSKSTASQAHDPKKLNYDQPTWDYNEKE